ncbi:hypothetical protein ACFS3C_03090 [Azotobacter vinelandii]
MTETGGSMQVVIRKPGAEDQLQSIQRHLLHMRARFSSGDFSTPASLHGADMPGLKELEAGASRMKVSYLPPAQWWRNPLRGRRHRHDHRHPPLVRRPTVRARGGCDGAVRPSGDRLARLGGSTPDGMDCR